MTKRLMGIGLALALLVVPFALTGCGEGTPAHDPPNPALKDAPPVPDELSRMNEGPGSGPSKGGKGAPN